MKPSVLNKLTCPVCSASGSPMNSLRAVTAKKNGGSPALFCRNCRSHFPAIHSIINLAPDSPEPVIFSTQWAMEFAPLVAVYDNIWRPILTSIISDLGWEMKTSKQLMNVSSGMDILDLACGTGNFTELFSDPAEPVDIIGADLSMPMLEHAGRNMQARGIHNVTLIRADAANWPFAPESFDRIHCAGALHLLPDVQNVFHSIYRSLKKERVSWALPISGEVITRLKSSKPWYPVRIGFTGSINRSCGIFPQEQALPNGKSEPISRALSSRFRKRRQREGEATVVP